MISKAFATNDNLQEKITERRYVTTYNNYYEFGTRKSDPVEKSQNFKTSPWNLTIDGEVEKKITLTVDEIKNSFPIEEKIYRLRCVEGWSMVIPWMGCSLNKLLEKASPKEYGFYSNVNPRVNHPRWSQASERVIGSGILSERIPTTMFNGYGDQVANLYSGMDLKKNF